jgi:dGTPase
VQNHYAKAQLKFVNRKNPDYSTGAFRNEFMRDRDRILYSKSFRRMSRKTQIFLPASDDHVRTRLTHSLEVAQIATISAQALGLDRDLTEAIALGHDIGHTPFGHTGERVLNLIATCCDDLGRLAPELSMHEMGFKHNLQGIRVTTDLDSLYQNTSGLNLSNYTMWGIQNHTSRVWKKCGFRYKSKSDEYICNSPQNRHKKQCIHRNNHDALKNKFYDQYEDLLKIYSGNSLGHYAWSFEAFLVEMADEIAQRHHDIEDGLIAAVIRSDDIFDWINELIKPYFDKEEVRIFSNISKESDIEYIISNISKLIVGCLNKNLIKNSLSNLASFYNVYDIKSENDFCHIYPQLSIEDEFTISSNEKMKVKEIISYPKRLREDENILKGKLKNGILNSYQVQRMDGKAQYIIRQLAKAYLSNPQQLPNNAINQLFITCYPDKENMDDLPIGDRRSWLNGMYFSTRNNEVSKHLLRVICDFISGMTDDFAITEHARLYSTTEIMNSMQR